MKADHAIVWRLSSTLNLVCQESGRITLQRNLREPIEIDSASADNLREALDRTYGEGARWQRR